MLLVLWLACTGSKSQVDDTTGLVDSAQDSAVDSDSGLFQVQPGSLVLDNVWVVDATGARKGAVVIQDEFIVAVLEGEQDWPGGIDYRDLEGFSVIPGLIDSHVHLSLSGATWWVGDTLVDNLKATLAWGVMGAVDAGGPEWTILLARRIADGSVFGPRLLSAGPFLTEVGSHPCETWNDATRCWYVEGNGTDLVDRLADQMSYAAKVVYSDYAFTDWSSPRLDIGDVAEIAGTGFPVLAHVAAGADAADLFAAGVEHLAHVPFDAPLSESVASLPFKSIHSTLSAFAGLDEVLRGGADLDGARFSMVSDPVRASWRWLQENPGAYSSDYLDANAQWLSQVHDNLVILKEAGANVLAGSDAGYNLVPHGSALHAEMEGLVAAGWSEIEAIAAATLLPAQLLAWNQNGLVAEGYMAELVVVEGNPSENISDTRNVEALVLGEQWLTPAEILAMDLLQEPAGPDGGLCLDDRDCQSGGADPRTRCDKVDHVCVEPCATPMMGTGCDAASWCAYQDGVATTAEGVCHRGDGCDWRTQDCAPEFYGENCVPGDLDTGVCWPSGPRAAGENCNSVDPGSYCERGHLCSPVDSTCYALCDPDADSCTAGTCQWQQDSGGNNWFGLCL